MYCLSQVHSDNGVTFVYVKYNNLYLLAVTKCNANASVMVLFLYRLVAVRTLAADAHRSLLLRHRRRVTAVYGTTSLGATQASPPPRSV